MKPTPSASTIKRLATRRRNWVQKKAALAFNQHGFMMETHCAQEPWFIEWVAMGKKMEPVTIRKKAKKQGGPKTIFAIVNSHDRSFTKFRTLGELFEATPINAHFTVQLANQSKSRVLTAILPPPTVIDVLKHSSAMRRGYCLVCYDTHQPSTPDIFT